MPRHLLAEEWFAEAYGWPPQVVREMPLDAYDWFPVIRQARSRAQAMRDKVSQPIGQNHRPQMHLRG